MAELVIEVRNLDLGYGDLQIMRNLNFSVNKGEIFVIMGSSGCGKSTLLKAMIGLKAPEKGDVFYRGKNFWDADEIEQEKLIRSFGVLYQGGALWSSFTLGENVALPLELYSNLTVAQIKEQVDLKLSLVGLSGYTDFYPEELSGGMRKRAGLARALSLEPQIVFFDEPSAGLDPITARMLDDLILELRDILGVTVVVVTHELASIFAIGDKAILLDADEKSMIAQGSPKELLSGSKDDRVIKFLTRGVKKGSGL
ncbi:MAG: ATP-binding cassette domain-containing protein [Candidatus Omnitrophota bacterium]